MTRYAAAAAHADQAKNVEHRKELMGTAAAPLQKVREHMRELAECMGCLHAEGIVHGLPAAAPVL